MYNRAASVHTLASSTGGAVTGASVLERHFSPRKSMSLGPNISHASPTSIPLEAKVPLQTSYNTLWLKANIFQPAFPQRTSYRSKLQHALCGRFHFFNNKTEVTFETTLLILKETLEQQSTLRGSEIKANNNHPVELVLIPHSLVPSSVF